MTDIAAGDGTGGDLKDRLAAWITWHRIRTFYGPEGTAERVIAANAALNVERWMAEDSRYLAARCRRIRDDADLSPRQFLAEAGFGGHVAGNARHAA